jgi:DNA recombination protein RmuC
MGEHLDRVGTSLGAAATAYNKAVGSLEARVLVTARRFAEMGVAAEPIEAPTQVEVAPRQLQSPEFTTATGESPAEVVSSGVGSPSPSPVQGDLDPAGQPPSRRPIVEKISP